MKAGIVCGLGALFGVLGYVTVQNVWSLGSAIDTSKGNLARAIDAVFGGALFVAGWMLDGNSNTQEGVGCAVGAFGAGYALGAIL